MGIKILIVIDMQIDFITGSLGTEEAEAIVPRVAEKIRQYNQEDVYYTMDTHKVEKYFDSQEGKKLPILHCVSGTVGWTWPVTLHSASSVKASHEFWKDQFGSVGLAESMWHKAELAEIESIEFVGLCTDICVITNVLLVKTFLPEVRIIVDASCCAGTTPEMHEKALDVMKSCQVEVVYG